MGRQANHKEIHWYQSLSIILWNGSCFPIFLGNTSNEAAPELQVEPNDIERRINQTIHLQQTREEVYIRSQVMQERIKKTFDKRTKAKDFYLCDKVLKWDSRGANKCKHGKFDFMWKGPYIIYAFRGNNAFFLREMDGTEAEGGPVNGQMLKHYIKPSY